MNDPSCVVKDHRRFIIYLNFTNFSINGVIKFAENTHFSDGYGIAMCNDSCVQFSNDGTSDASNSANAVVIDPLINIVQLFRDTRTFLARPQARSANRHRV